MSPRAHWQSLETVLVVMTGGGGLLLHLVDRGQGSNSISYSAQDGPRTESYPAPNVNSAAVEDPCFIAVHFVIILGDKNNKKNHTPFIQANHTTS